MKKATIHDICDLTGLSSGTVSKYLNGGAIKEKNRILLADAIQKLNYHVDEYARGLITNKTKTVGILVSRLDNLFYSRMIFDIEEQLYRKGYANDPNDPKHPQRVLIVVSNTNHSALRERNCSDIWTGL